MSRDYRSFLQEEGRDLSDVPTTIRGEPTPGAAHRRLSSQGALGTPLLQEEPLWEISKRGEYDVPRKPVAGNHLVGRTLSPPPGSRLPPGGPESQFMPPSGSGSRSETLQGELHSSASQFEHQFKRSDTYNGGGLDMPREEEDISHAKTTTNFDEYELGNVQIEDSPVLPNDNNYDDNTGMLELLAA